MMRTECCLMLTARQKGKKEKTSVKNLRVRETGTISPVYTTINTAERHSN